MNTPRKTFYGLLGSIAAVIAAGVGLFYILDGQLTSLNADIAKLMAEQEAGAEQITALEAADQQLDQLEAIEELADQVLPTTKQQANVVAEVKSFIQSAGLEFSSVTFSGSDPNGNLAVSQTQARPGLVGVRVLPVTAVINAGATYSQVIDLLETIENNQRKMQVTNISLTPEPTGGTFSTLTLQVDVYVRTAAPTTQPATDDDSSSSPDEGES